MIMRIRFYDIWFVLRGQILWEGMWLKAYVSVCNMHIA